MLQIQKTFQKNFCKLSNKVQNTCTMLGASIARGEGVTQMSMDDPHNHFTPAPLARLTPGKRSEDKIDA